jgi:hypothetical protein
VQLIQEILTAMQLALQFLPALLSLIKQFRETLPQATPQEHSIMAANALAQAIMQSHPELVNGTTQSMLTTALHAIGEHAAANILAKQQEAPQPPPASV